MSFSACYKPNFDVFIADIFLRFHLKPQFSCLPISQCMSEERRSKRYKSEADIIELLDSPDIDDVEELSTHGPLDKKKLSRVFSGPNNTENLQFTSTETPANNKTDHQVVDLTVDSHSADVLNELSKHDCPNCNDFNFDSENSLVAMPLHVQTQDASQEVKSKQALKSTRAKESLRVFKERLKLLEPEEQDLAMKFNISLQQQFNAARDQAASYNRRSHLIEPGISEAADRKFYNTMWTHYVNLQECVLEYTRRLHYGRYDSLTNFYQTANSQIHSFLDDLHTYEESRLRMRLLEQEQEQSQSHLRSRPSISLVERATSSQNSATTYNYQPYLDLDKDLSEIVNNIHDTLEPAELPSELEVIPMIHQRLGLAWLLKNETGKNHGGILADDMGLGKTIQTIALIYANPPPKNGPQQTLIVCPVALLETWRSELQNRVDERHRLRVYIHHKATNRHTIREAEKLRSKADVVITTYATLALEHKASLSTSNPRPSLLFSMDWWRVVLDEAHCIKNASSVSSKACTALNAVNRLCLTGTPMQNTLVEIWSLVRFLHLRPYFDHPELFKKIVPAYKPNMVSQDVEINDSKLRSFRALLASILLRRKKDTIVHGRPILAHLPMKRILDISVEMAEMEMATYDAMRGEILDKARALSRRQGNIFQSALVFLMRLRQQACHRYLIKVTTRAKEECFLKPSLTELSAAAEFSPNIVEQILEHTSTDQRLTCPRCHDEIFMDERTAVLYPCNHYLCIECLALIKDDVEFEAYTKKCSDCGENVMNYANVEAILQVNSDKEKPLTQHYEILKQRYENKRARQRLFLSERRQTLQKMLDRHDREKALTEDDKSDNVVQFGSSSDPDDLHEFIQIDIDQVAKLFSTHRIFSNGWVGSAKMTSILRILREIRDEDPTDKVVVFSVFTSFLDLLTIPLDAARISYLEYNGRMAATERTSVLKQFRTSPMQVLLTSLKAGNVGLTLTEANRVILVEPFWNPFVEQQAMDRVHRIGQQKPVTVYRLINKGTVEEQIVNLRNMKQRLIDTALSSEAMTSTAKLSRNDLLYLLGARATPSVAST